MLEPNVKWLVIIAVAIFASPALAQVYRYEAETGTKTGTSISTAIPGYSGTGYVTGFDSPSGTDSVQLQVDVPNGLYEMWVGYRSPYGDKGYNYRVDSEYGGGTFNQSNAFTTDRAGIFNMSGGINRQKTLAGHQHYNSQNLPFPSSTYLNLSGGLKPAIRASDFIEYSPTRISHGANPNNESEQSIAWAKQNNGILSMNWHWNAPANLVDTQCGSNCGANDYPWWRGFYTQGTTFNLAGALANPSGSDYQLILRDIDAISRQLVKSQDAGVPGIWRPLHEAQGNANGTSGSGAWFWWGAAGPDNFKQLWRLMYNRMTTQHAYADGSGGQFPGLHNLIWEYTSSAAKSGWLNWYPGDDVVDMV